LALTDDAKLGAALTSHLEAVQDLFTDSNAGLAVGLSDYLDATTGDGGALAARQDNFTRQSQEIDDQIATMERRIQDEQDRLTASFVAMEKAQANIKQQLQFLQQRFGNSTS
jgi:flagellar capping protein FliD